MVPVSRGSHLGEFPHRESARSSAKLPLRMFAVSLGTICFMLLGADDLRELYEWSVTVSNDMSLCFFSTSSHHGPLLPCVKKDNFVTLTYEAPTTGDPTPTDRVPHGSFAPTTFPRHSTRPPLDHQPDPSRIHFLTSSHAFVHDTSSDDPRKEVQFYQVICTPLASHRNRGVLVFFASSPASPRRLIDSNLQLCTSTRSANPVASPAQKPLALDNSEFGPILLQTTRFCSRF